MVKIIKYLVNLYIIFCTVLINSELTIAKHVKINVRKSFREIYKVLENQKYF